MLTPGATLTVGRASYGVALFPLDEQHASPHAGAADGRGSGPEDALRKDGAASIARPASEVLAGAQPGDGGKLTLLPPSAPTEHRTDPPARGHPSSYAGISPASAPQKRRQVMRPPPPSRILLLRPHGLARGSDSSDQATEGGGKRGHHSVVVNARRGGGEASRARIPGSAAE